jgi:hypothetical protein
MKDDKKSNKKRRKDNKTLRKKMKRGCIKRKNFDKKTVKEKEPIINVLAHELLSFTL